MSEQSHNSVDPLLFARGFVEISGLSSAEQEDILNVSFARACYIIQFIQEQRLPEQYAGRFPAVVAISTRSILLQMGIPPQLIF